MKVGTITFHWVNNYGAVLQAYALQQYLLSKGFDTQIIDYRPRLVILRQYFLALKSREFPFFKQEKQLKNFRKKYLNLTKKSYPTNNSLKKEHFLFNAIIAGSDQIWNESFTLRAEGKPTLSYFLNFASSSVKRISYAVSFGFHKPIERYIEVVKDEIKKFCAISVREDDGKDIVEAFSLSSEIVCDPTALLKKEDYEKIANKDLLKPMKVFAYILRKNQTDAWKTAQYVGNIYGEKISENKFCDSMENWLASILNSEIVVTNSFHGLMLSIIMNKPFIALTIKDSGMNSRISTLLSNVGLTSRCIDEFSEDKIQSILSEKIDWNSVNGKINQLRSTGVDFLNRVLD